MDYSSLPPNQQNFLAQGFYAVTRLGHEAVIVFFVLSGFLVGGKSLIRIHDGSFQPRNYAIDRIVRIMLPLLSALLLFALVCAISGKDFSIPIALGNLFSLQGILCPVSFETLWSLSYEVWFYIIMCAIGYCFIHKRKRKVFIGITTLTLCMVVFCILQPYYLFIWFLGAFGFFIAPCRNRLLKYISIAATFGFLALLQLTSDTNAATLAVSLLSWISRPIIEVAFGICFCICLSQIIQYAPTSSFGNRLNIIGTKLAAFSYTLYLTHIPVRELLRYFGAPKSESLTLTAMLLFMCWLVVAMIIAYVLYLAFERNTNVVKGVIKMNLIRINLL